MAETYWETQARLGQLPPGMQVTNDPLSGTGRYRESVVQPVYGTPNAPARMPAVNPKQTLRDKVFADYKKQFDAANNANQGRYDEAKGVMLNGIPMGPNYSPGPPEEFAMTQVPLQPGVYTPPQAATDAINKAKDLFGSVGKVGEIAFRGGAASADQQAVNRGIYNTSTGLNTREVTGSTAAMAAQQSTIRAGLDAQRQGMDVYGAAQDDERRKRLDYVNLLQSKTDAQPDISPLLKLAMTEGSGTTQGMEYAPSYGGGGGGYRNPGIGGSGYGAYGSPMYGGPQQPAGQGQKDLNRAQSYRVSRGEALPGSTPIPMRPAGTAPLPASPVASLANYGQNLWRKAAGPILPKRPLSIYG
jgi:hypothetical protein